MPELAVGVFTVLFGKLAAAAQVKTGAALEPVALAVETEAKRNASNGQHRYGTRTPARPGSGPAKISGTLVGSITHTTPVPDGFGWKTRVGVAGGQYPPYNHRTHSGRYGYYLETGLRNGATYPFLRPAFQKVAKETAFAVFEGVFTTGWDVGF